MRKNKTISIRLVPMIIFIIILTIVLGNQFNKRQYIGVIEQNRRGANVTLDSTKTTAEALQEAINNAPDRNNYYTWGKY